MTAPDEYPEEAIKYIIQHKCCGCSCTVCAKTHQSGIHTPKCWEVFFNGIRTQRNLALAEIREEASMGDDNR